MNKFNANGVYIRVGSTARRASIEEIFRMKQKSSLIPFDNELSLIEELTFFELNKSLKQSNLEFDPKGLRLVRSQDNKYNNAAFLISDQSNVLTKIAVYNGLNTMTFKDNNNLEGSILNEAREGDELSNIIDFLTNNGLATRQQIQEELDVSKAKAINLLNTMIKEGLVEKKDKVDQLRILMLASKFFQHRYQQNTTSNKLPKTCQIAIPTNKT